MFVSCAGSFVIDYWSVVVLLLSFLGSSTSHSFLDTFLVFILQEKFEEFPWSLLGSVDIATFLMILAIAYFSLKVKSKSRKDILKELS